MEHFCFFFLMNFEIFVKEKPPRKGIRQNFHLRKLLTSIKGVP